MSKAMTLAFAGIAGFAVMLGAANYGSGVRVYRWLNFYAWKLIASKAHGGQRVSVNDVSIYYEAYGAGPPVLVLHGGLGSIEGMSHQIMALAASHYVIAPDSRGHGRSTDSNAPLSYSLMSDDMLKLLDRLQIDQVDVVGWSDGGIVGLDLAIRHPDRIRRLVAISANFDVDGLLASSTSEAEIPRRPIRYALMAPDPAHWPTLYRKVLTMWQTQPHYTLSDLRHIKAPTLIMAGEMDIVKREHTDELTKAIAHSQEVIIEGGTHAVIYEKPEIINSHILMFLDAQD
jgi:pimeloyl-ACP methyl ester carboxylesterase